MNHESTSPTRVSSTLRFFFGLSGSFAPSTSGAAGATSLPLSTAEVAIEAPSVGDDSGTALVLPLVELDADSGMLARAGAGVVLCECEDAVADTGVCAVVGRSGLGSGALRFAGVGEGVTCAELV